MATTEKVGDLLIAVSESWNVTPTLATEGIEILALSVKAQEGIPLAVGISTCWQDDAMDSWPPMPGLSTKLSSITQRTFQILGQKLTLDSVLVSKHRGRESRQTVSLHYTLTLADIRYSVTVVYDKEPATTTPNAEEHIGKLLEVLFSDIRLQR